MADGWRRCCLIIPPRGELIRLCVACVHFHGILGSVVRLWKASEECFLYCCFVKYPQSPDPTAHCAASCPQLVHSQCSFQHIFKELHPRGPCTLRESPGCQGLGFRMAQLSRPFLSLGVALACAAQGEPTVHAGSSADSDHPLLLSPWHSSGLTRAPLLWSSHGCLSH